MDSADADDSSSSSSSSDDDGFIRISASRARQRHLVHASPTESEPVPSTSSGISAMSPNHKGGVAVGLPNTSHLELPRNRPAPQSPKNFKSEKMRVQSYAGFPVASMDVRQMAATGFYYTKSQDIVRCAFCGVEVGRWEEGDDPTEEHRKWSKNCKFLNGTDVGNIRVDPEDPPPLPPMDINLGVDECGLYGIKRQDPWSVITSLEKLGINKRYDPVHPQYATLEARLESFHTWPVGLKLRPQELAEAGFFYTGLGDKTACFQCGGGLKDWADTDEPWREHALFFSKCSYVIQTKGREFVAEVLGKRPRTLTPEEIHALTIPKELSNVVYQRTPSPSSSSSSSSDESVLPCNVSVKSDEIVEPSIYKKDENESILLNGNVQGPTKRIEDARACKICFIEEIGVVFLPCGHLVACPKCAPSLTTCAVCRQPFSATVRAYLS